MRLSDHFTLAELTASQTAARLGIDNSPPAGIIDALRETAAMLELVRRHLGNKPITISSGYRCLAVNRAIGSGDSSAHVRGMAADFICPSFGSPLAVCQALTQSDIAYDQLIREFDDGARGWTHIGRSSGLPRRMVLTIDGAGTRHGLE
jgi:hypothetical protein